MEKGDEAKEGSSTFNCRGVHGLAHQGILVIKIDMKKEVENPGLPSCEPDFPSPSPSMPTFTANNSLSIFNFADIIVFYYYIIFFYKLFYYYIIYANNLRWHDLLVFDRLFTLCFFIWLTLRSNICFETEQFN